MAIQQSHGFRVQSFICAAKGKKEVSDHIHDATGRLVHTGINKSCRFTHSSPSRVTEKLQTAQSGRHAQGPGFKLKFQDDIV